jgi:hypothetical protein
MRKYLIDQQHRYGLYLVGWFHCDQWGDSDYRKKKNSDMTIDEAQAFFDKQAIGLSKGGRQIKALMVNASLPK